MNDLSAATEPKRAAEYTRIDACFIEQQLPVSKLSKESYKERKSGAGQTLTGLGSYWKGRKPLILVRAVVLGLLLPATGDPARDREVFLKLMLMDDGSLRKRKAKPLPVARARQLLPANLHAEAFHGGRWSRRLSREQRTALELQAFDKMGLDEKLSYCIRPEELPESALDDIWPEVNAHLGTTATSLAELVRQLGIPRRATGRCAVACNPERRSMSMPPGLPTVGIILQTEEKNPWESLSASTGVVARTQSA